MTSPRTVTASQPQPDLPGQTVVVLGGSAGIGLETARRARNHDVWHARISPLLLSGNDRSRNYT